MFIIFPNIEYVQFSLLFLDISVLATNYVAFTQY